MDPDTCIMCGATATHRDAQTSATLCAQHARIEVVGPRPARRGPSALPQLAIRDLTPDDRPAVRTISLAFWGKTTPMFSFGRSYDLLERPALALSQPPPTAKNWRACCSGRSPMGAAWWLI